MSFFNRNVIDLTDDEFHLLRDYIYENTGIYFKDNKKYLLINRLNQRLIETNSKTFKDYYFYLKYDKTGVEFKKLLNSITTNETSFFRNEFHMESFSDFIIPELVKKKKNNGDRKIKIWSAGCSTGEEPYSLAIILNEKGVMQEFDVEIIGNDLSDNVLNSARAGIYNKLSLRNTPEYIVNKYFKKINNFTFKIDDKIKKYVKFTFGNLVKPSTLLLINNLDIIFCRNVMIYFDIEARKRVVKLFYDKLLKGGYLFIGHSETLHGISTAFKIVHYKRAVFYRKDE